MTSWHAFTVVVAIGAAVGGAITFSQGYVTQADLNRAEARILATEETLAARAPIIFSIPADLRNINRRLDDLEVGQRELIDRTARIEALLLQSQVRGQVRVGRPPEGGFGRQ